MFGILLALGAVVLIAVLVLIYRIYTLVNVARGTEKVRVSTSNKVNAALFLLFLIGSLVLFTWYSIKNFDAYQLPMASEHADDYEYLFWVTTAVSLVAVLITNVLLFFFSFRYQYKESRKAVFYPDNTKLEVIWTLIPAVVLTVLIFGGFKVWNKMTDKSPEDAEVLEIMGYQFAWMARYPGPDNQLGEYDFRNIDATNQMGLDMNSEAAYDDFMPREIHLPVGKPVEIKIRARDVLHSVYLPHFRQKIDAMPGMPTRMWFVPTKTTAEMRKELDNPDFNYELACAEVCGRGHFSMRMIVVVDTQEDYEKWYAEQESFLKQNPNYMENVPAEKRAMAELKAGLKTDLTDLTSPTELTKN